MITTYETGDEASLQFKFDPSKGQQVMLTIRDEDTVIRTHISRDVAIALKRNLNRIIDPAGGKNPVAPESTIGRVHALFKAVQAGRGEEYRIAVANALKDYIELIEYVNQEDDNA